MTDALHEPEALYLHIRVLVGVVVGLGLTNLLQGIARVIEHPREKPIYWVHLGWVGFMFIYLMHFWWWEFRFAITQQWTFLKFVFMVAFALLLYLLSALLFPERMSEQQNYRDYYYARRRWFFGLLALTFLVDLYDTLLKGIDYFNKLGPEYLVRNFAFVALCMAATATRNGIFHGAFVAAGIVYEISWILRVYNVMP